MMNYPHYFLKVYKSLLIFAILLLVRPVLAQSSLEVEFLSVPQVPPVMQPSLINALAAHLEKLPANETRFSVTSYRVVPGWAEVVLVPTFVVEQGWEVDFPNSSIIRLVAQEISPNQWLYYFGDEIPSNIVSLIPETFLDLSPRNSPQSVNHLFPWSAPQTWWKVQGWHSGTHLDFQPHSHGNPSANPGTEFAVLASEGGQLSQICNDGYQVALQINHSSGWTRYVHLQANSFRSDLVGQQVVRGQYLGHLYTGTQGQGSYNGYWYRFYTTCGYGTAIHLHFGVSDTNITIDGHNINGVANSPFATNYTSTNQRIDNSNPCGSLANNCFQNATVINSLPFTVEQSVAGATAEGSDPNMSCIGDGNPRHFTRTVWFKYTPSPSGSVRFEITEGANQFDSVMALYTGTLGNLTQVACNDDIGSGGYPYRSAFNATLNSGTTYYLMVAQWTDGSYNPTNPILRLSVTQQTTSPVITVQPSDQTKQCGQTATLSVTATGTAPLSYQWYRGSTSNTSNPISGATSASYTTPVLQETSTYWVRVSNGLGSTDSRTVTVAVVPCPDLLTNGDFSNGMNNWAPWGGVIARVNSGVLEMYRNVGTSGNAVVLQNTGKPLPNNAPIEISAQIGNNSSGRKRVSLIMHDGDWSDMQVCTFWLAPGSPLQTYTMRAKTTEEWTAAHLGIYVIPADGQGWLRVDNVSMQHKPALTVNYTTCIDPMAPNPGVGADSANLITNPGFDSMAGWLTYAQIQWVHNNGVFEFFRPTGSQSGGVVFQNTGATAGANTPLEATFQLGNNSPYRMRATILLHDGDFSDMQVCAFWVPPNTGMGTYTMRTHTTEAWTNISLSVYPSTALPVGFLRLDNVSLRRRPTLDVNGTDCYPAGVTPADVAPFEIAPEPILPVQPSILPQGELPPLATAIPFEVQSGGDGEGQMNEHFGE
jgi:hypothetical protein